MSRAIVAECLIRAAPENVRHLAQTPDQHRRWDLRFTDIAYLPRTDPTQPQRFRYATKMGLMSIEGWGETVADRDDLGSGLRFGSDDPKSLIREGSGMWRYESDPSGVRFRTVYDYRTRLGMLGGILDRLAFRPVMTWATRWSFDRLRLWLERGIPPEIAFRLWIAKRLCLTMLGLVWILAGLLPKVAAPRPEELALVAKSHLVVISPSFTLATLGWLEVLLGAWLLAGRAERTAVTVATALMVGLAALVMGLDPTWASDPYSGLVKNLGLLGCAAAVWLLSPMTPNARRAAPRRQT